MGRPRAWLGLARLGRLTHTHSRDPGFLPIRTSLLMSGFGSGLRLMAGTRKINLQYPYGGLVQPASHTRPDLPCRQQTCLLRMDLIHCLDQAHSQNQASKPWRGTQKSQLRCLPCEGWDADCPKRTGRANMRTLRRPTRLATRLLCYGRARRDIRGREGSAALGNVMGCLFFGRLVRVHAPLVDDKKGFNMLLPLPILGISSSM